MPSRYFVPIHRVDPARVRLEHVHAAVSNWFDTSPAEHAANEKPYTVSPMTQRGAETGVEVTVLTVHALTLLQRACRPSQQVRLGNQSRPLGRPQLLHSTDWADLVKANRKSRWTLEFLTPTTFRNGNRSSPLPCLTTILTGLACSWNTWSKLPPLLTAPRWDTVWVSDLDLRSTLLTITRLKVDQSTGTSSRIPTQLSGVLGTMTVRCDDTPTAAMIDPLFALAPYAGVGSMRSTGLGQTRLFLSPQSTHGTVRQEADAASR